MKNLFKLFVFIVVLSSANLSDVRSAIDSGEKEIVVHAGKGSDCSDLDYAALELLGAGFEVSVDFGSGNIVSRR